MALAPGGAKQKGSAGEYEVISLLTGWAASIGIRLVLERNLEQVRHGGADINGVPGLEIEVKRVEATGINSWWKQVLKAADKSGKRPFLIHRRNRQPWRVRVHLYAAEYTAEHVGVTIPLVVDLELEDARRWFQGYLGQRSVDEIERSISNA